MWRILFRARVIVLFPSSIPMKDRTDHCVNYKCLSSRKTKLGLRYYHSFFETFDSVKEDNTSSYECCEASGFAYRS